MTTGDHMHHLLDAARHYARQGYRVHPLHPRGKRPLLSSWQTRATTDASAIARWWAETPDANIGIATGAESGLYVIDLDTEEAEDAWDDLCEERGGASDPPAVETGGQNRGVHLWYRIPDGADARNSASRIAPGIDTRGEGGYVVAPPSVVEVPYEWLEGEDDLDNLPEMPPWVPEAIEKGKKAKKDRKGRPPRRLDWRDNAHQRPPGRAEATITHPYVERAIRDELDRVRQAAEGGRNGQLNLSAFAVGQFAPAYVDEGELLDLLVGAADAAGLPRGEATATAESGLTAGMSDPRSVPEDGEDAIRDLDALVSAVMEAEDGGAAREAMLEIYRATDVLGDLEIHAPGEIAAAITLLASHANITKSDASQIQRIARHAGKARRGEARRAREEARRGEGRGIFRGYYLNELGLATRFADEYGDRLRYCAQLAGWYAYDDEDGCWFPSYDSAVGCVRRFLADLLEEAEEAEHDEAWDLANRMSSRRSINDLLGLAATMRSVPAVPEDFDRHAMLLGTPGATLDLQAGTALEPDERDMITRMTEARYDEDAECPEFDRFLDEIMCGRPELVEFLWELIGYTLQGGNPEEIMVICRDGTPERGGRNGKSTLLNVLRHMLGDYARQVNTEALMESQNPKGGGGPTPEIARLRGARMVTCSEVRRGRRLNETMLRQITGKDTITAAFKHRDTFEFKPQFLLWMACNYEPEIRGQDGATWRRIVVVPFDLGVSKEDADPNLEQVLLRETDGILTRALRYAAKTSPAAGRGLHYPEVVLRTTEGYREHEDALAPWLAACTRANPGSEVELKDLYRSYETFCEIESDRAMGKRGFGACLTERGYPSRRGAQGLRLRQGLQLIQPYGGNDRDAFVRRRTDREE